MHNISQQPTGDRTLSRAAVAALADAADYDGLPDGVSHPMRLLVVTAEAARLIGLSAGALRLLEILYSYTQPTDWTDRPIVWPSNAELCERLSIGRTALRTRLRALADARLITHRDSPNGHRWGRRGAHGQIVDAYGIDLSPMAARYADLLALVQADQAERSTRRVLRRRALRARRSIRQLMILATAETIQCADPRPTADAICAAIDHPTTLDRLRELVDHIECAQAELYQSITAAIADPEPAETTPMGADSRPPIEPTNISNTKQVTVFARQESSSSGDNPTSSATSAPNDIAESTIVTPTELAQLAPGLGAYLYDNPPTWTGLTEAADRYRHQVGISGPLWRRACHVLGRRDAVVALAVLSTRRQLRSPGGYFHAMVAKAQRQELHLSRSIFGLRDATYGRRPRKSPHHAP